MKFKEGDKLVKQSGNNILFDILNDCEEIRIKNIVQINNTIYYRLDTIPDLKQDIDVLFPQLSIDVMYDLDKVWDRKNKIDKIKNGTRIL